MNRSKFLIVIAAMMAVAGSTVQAQVDLDLGKMATQMRANQEELRKYSWQTKMVFLVDDAQRRVDTYTVRYVMGGMVEKMQISSEVAKGKVRRPDGKKLSKKELEAATDFVTQVKNQLDGYLNPLFAEKAVATSTTRSEDGTIILESKDVVTTGDSVVIILDLMTKRPRTAKIRSAIDGSPVSLDVTFGSIEYGPNYPSSSVTTSQWQGFELTIVTENSNYVRQGV